MALFSLGSDPAERSARAALLAMLVHDLRGPVTVAMSHAWLLAESASQFDEATRAEMARDILISVEALAALLDDFALLASVGDGKAPEPQQDVDPAAALRAALDDPARMALAAQLEGAPHVLADETWLGRVLAELVANARLAAGGADPQLVARADGATVIVDVSDAGPPIPLAERPAALDHLLRARGQRRSTPRVTGLGVTVARVLSEAMGGRLEIDDALDGGCVFRLTLPASQSAML
jgi:signal transduction histidine kinase